MLAISCCLLSIVSSDMTVSCIMFIFLVCYSHGVPTLTFIFSNLCYIVYPFRLFFVCYSNGVPTLTFIFSNLSYIVYPFRLFFVCYSHGVPTLTFIFSNLCYIVYPFRLFKIRLLFTWWSHLSDFHILEFMWYCLFVYTF